MAEAQKAVGREIRRGAGEASSSTYTPVDMLAELAMLRHDFEEVRCQRPAED